MKLEEVLPAFRDGKKIYRDSKNRMLSAPITNGICVQIFHEDINATDWEIEIPKVTITLSDLEKAWEKTGREGRSPVVAMLARELGL